MATFIKIATVTVGSGGASIMSFSSIPQTYTDLKIVYSTRGTAAAVQNMYMTINGVTTNFTYRSLYGDGTSNGVGSGSGSVGIMGIAQGDNYTANTFDNGEIYIPNYTSSNYKSISTDTTTENNSTTSYIEPIASLWSNTAAITSIDLNQGSGNFKQYSTATLYGIKNS